MNTPKPVGKHIKKRKVSKTISKPIIEHVLVKLKNGIVPWRMNKASIPFALNYESGKDYQGLSWFMLNCLNQKDCNFYLSWEQIKSQKGKVKVGSKATYHYFYQSEFSVERKIVNEAIAKKSKRQGIDITETLVLKKEAIFHSSQIENIEFKKMLMPQNGFSTEEECDLVMSLIPIKPEIAFTEEDIGKYNSVTDKIEITRISKYEDNMIEFYKLLFPALVHWTGHKTRLGRDAIVKQIPPKKKGYEIEHLIGEIGATYLFAFVGIERIPITPSQKYLSFWVETLESNPAIFFKALEEAQLAVNFILEDSTLDIHQS